MKTMLVPTDFSACAGNAFRYALEIAAFSGAEIHVLHVLYPNEGVDNSIYNAFWADDYLAQRNKELRNWVHRNRKTPATRKVAVGFSCAIGFPVPSILEKAADLHADLIVMGTTGSTGIRGVFLGSIAAGVLSRTRIPVLAIPKKAVIGKGKDVVFTTDYRFKTYAGPLKVLRALVDFQGRRMRVVHIIDKPGEQPDKAREATLIEKLAGFDCDFHYLHDQDVPQAISNFMESVDAGLLVATAHDHSLLHSLFNDSVTRRLAHRTKVPLLVLHDHS